jgi:hypothetical protein
MFSITTIDECIATHQAYLLPPNIVHAVPHRQSAMKVPDCPSYLKLQELVKDMLAETQSVHNFISSCKLLADAKLNSNVRQAAGFHPLHELALLKEFSAQPSDAASASALADHLKMRSSKQSVTRQSHCVAQHAKAKLEHL